MPITAIQYWLFENGETRKQNVQSLGRQLAPTDLRPVLDIIDNPTQFGPGSYPINVDDKNGHTTMKRRIIKYVIILAIGVVLLYSAFVLFMAVARFSSDIGKCPLINMEDAQNALRARYEINSTFKILPGSEGTDWQVRWKIPFEIDGAKRVAYLECDDNMSIRER